MSALQAIPLNEWQGASGFIRHWFVCGFFEAGVEDPDDPDLYDEKISSCWETDHLTAWGGEAGIDDLPQPQGHAAMEWLPVQADAFDQKLKLSDIRHGYPKVDTVIRAWGDKPAQWYALAILDSAVAQKVHLKFSVHDGTRLFCNGDLVFDKHSWHGVIYDEECMTLHLQSGRNTLLFKNERQAMVARLLGTDDQALDDVQQLADAEQPQRQSQAAYTFKSHCAALKVCKPFTATTPGALEAWQQNFHKDYQAALGQGLYAGHGSATVRCLRTVPCNGYTRHELKVPCEGDGHFDAAVLIPDDERRNGRTIIHPHGHRFLFRHLIGLDPEPQPRWSQIGPYDANYAEQLAQAGFVTAAFAQRGFDNRNDVEDAHACNRLGRMAAALGMSLPRLYIDDIQRIADYLATIDGVDGDRLGIAGLSGGATISWITAAYDKRFTAAASFCGLMRARHWGYTGACGMQIVPGLFPKGDTGEVLSLIAPRAFLIGQGRFDATFNIIESESIYHDALRAWSAAGVPEKLQFVITETGHQFHVPTAVDFFLRHL